MIDSHCHLDLPAFLGKQEELLANCARLGIQRILIPGLSLTQFETLLSLQKQLTLLRHESLALPVIDIGLGCHPYFLQQFNDSERQQHNTQLNALGEQHAQDIVAIGECGIDESIPLSMAYQESVFRQHIELASQLSKPLVIHHRKSHNQLIRILKQAQFRHGGIIHAFSGSQQDADTYIEMGFLLGVGGTITYPRAKKTRATIANVDLHYLVLETDAPDMPLNGFQGEVNSPEKLPLVAASLAELKSISLKQVQEQTSSNYKSLLKLN